ncbi:MAG: class I SAM-dependent methyltransferase, partial [Aggregatilineales bacterium]
MKYTDHNQNSDRVMATTSATTFTTKTPVSSTMSLFSSLYNCHPVLNHTSSTKNQQLKANNQTSSCQLPEITTVADSNSLLQWNIRIHHTKRRLRGLMQIDIHTIATAQQRSRFPLPADIIKTLGHYCDLKSHTRVLDLACGRGELLIQWAAQFGIKGTGIDDNPDAILQAHHRADELKVWAEVQFSAVEEVAEFPQAFHQYHTVTCFEAAWITESLHTTLDLMREALRDNQRGL